MDSDYSNQCGICVNGLVEPITVIGCGHRFCRTCWAQWEHIGGRSCPDCQAKMKKGQSNGELQSNSMRGQLPPAPIRSASNSKILLPTLPLPVPHAEMMLLYHVHDSEDKSRCNLGCYVRISNPARRFFYCENCETAFHKLNYQAPQDSLQSRNLSASLKHMIENPTAKSSLLLEDQQKRMGLVHMHEQLLGHALYCNDEPCGYRTCSLMKKYIWPFRESRKRRYSAIDVTDATGAAKTFYASSPSTRHRPTASLTTSPLDSEKLAARELQIDRSVGLGEGCRLCIRAANLLHKHEQVCARPHCQVVYCAELKRINAQLSKTVVDVG